MTAAQTLNPDRRTFPRHRVLKRGKVVFNTNQSVIDCTVRDLSQGGARIACPQASALPDTFVLVFVSEREVRDVRVAWRRMSEMGVEFVSGPRSSFRLLT